MRKIITVLCALLMVGYAVKASATYPTWTDGQIVSASDLDANNDSTVSAIADTAAANRALLLSKSAARDTVAAVIADSVDLSLYIPLADVRDSAAAVLADSVDLSLYIPLADVRDSADAAIAADANVQNAITYTTIGALKLTLDGDDLTNGQYSGIVDSVTVGENVSAGQGLYQEPTTGKWLLAQSDSTASCGAQVLAVASGTAGTPCIVLRYGYLKLDSWTTVQTIGPVYVDESTPGLLNTEAPAGSGEALFAVGSCVGTDLLFFNPPPPIYYVVRP